MKTVGILIVVMIAGCAAPKRTATPRQQEAAREQLLAFSARMADLDTTRPSWERCYDADELRRSMRAARGTGALDAATPEVRAAIEEDAARLERVLDDVCHREVISLELRIERPAARLRDAVAALP